MNAMHLRSLKEGPPIAGFDVGVIEELADRGTERIDGAAAAKPQQRIDQELPMIELTIISPGMLVKRRDDLDPLRAVMNLMKAPPQQVDSWRQRCHQ